MDLIVLKWILKMYFRRMWTVNFFPIRV